MLFISVICTQLVKAEATKEIYSDAGFYTANMNLLNFNPLTPPQFDITSDPNPPEGIKIARQVTIAGEWSGWGIANVTAPGSYTVVPKDYSDYLGGQLRFALKSNGPVTVKVQYQGVYPDPSISIGSTGGQWDEIVIPLSLLGANASRLTKVIYPVIIVDEVSPIQRIYYVDHIRWTKPLASLSITPTSTQVNPNGSRQFTVEGQDAAGDAVIVYPQFSSTIGTLNPSGAARSAVLTVGGSLTDGHVTATAIDEGIDATAFVDVTNASLTAQFGILSETHEGVELGGDNPDENSHLILYSEDINNPSSLPVFDELTGNSPEGTNHYSLQFKSKSLAQQYQGMGIVWGLGGSPETEVQDLSKYYDGSLRFWFKGSSASSDLTNKLAVSIRSGNIEAGNELSKVLLKDYVTFNDTWQAVVIPVSDFAGAAPWADLTRVKVLASFSIEGRLSAPNAAARTVYLDNVRWDTQKPGALSSISIDPLYDSSTLPVGLINQYVATGQDAAGIPVDVYPTWTFPGTTLGTLTTTEGPMTYLRASETPVSGSLKAAFSGKTKTVSISVQNVSFPGKINVLSDAGLWGNLEVALFPNNGTSILGETVPNGAPGDATEYLSASLNLFDSVPGAEDAFAVFYIQQNESGIDLSGVSDGFLKFYARTEVDLEISLGSASLDPNTSQAKVTLSELGVPISAPGTGSWQKVMVPLSLFKQKEPGLNFSEITSIFIIGSSTKLIGEQVGAPFDFDFVECLSLSPIANLPPFVDAGDDQAVELPTEAGDGDIDGDDFLIWQNHFGQSLGDPGWYDPADTDNDGDVDGNDFLIWQTGFGSQQGDPNYNPNADTDPAQVIVDIIGVITDDGLPNPPGSVSVSWSVVSGNPNSVEIINGNHPVVRFVISETGLYTFRLTANDGELSTSDDVSVNVYQIPGGAAAAVLPASMAEQVSVDQIDSSSGYGIRWTRSDSQNEIQIERSDDPDSLIKIYPNKGPASHDGTIRLNQIRSSIPDTELSKLMTPRQFMEVSDLAIKIVGIVQETLTDPNEIKLAADLMKELNKMRAVEIDFTIETEAKSEVRIVTTDEGMRSIEMRGPDVARNYSYIHYAYVGNSFGTIRVASGKSVKGDLETQIKKFNRQVDWLTYKEETKYLAHGIKIALPYATPTQRAVIERILRELDVRLTYQPHIDKPENPVKEDKADDSPVVTGVFLRQGEQKPIQVSIPYDSSVRLEVKNRFGLVVRTLVNTYVHATANYVVMFDGRDDNGQLLPPGTYFVFCQAGDHVTRSIAVVSR
jgi:hypothetical protein